MVLEQLDKYLRELSAEGIALAFSGGVDSTLLLAVLSRLQQEKAFPFAVLTMETALQDSTEMKEAQKLAESFGVKQTIFSFNLFSLPEVKQNCTDRCYHCKKAIFSKFVDFKEKHGLKYLIDGTNADDLNIYRPGRKALRELGVLSPLAELGISKKQIREASAALGLPTASKPAVSCLATRFEYNTILSEEMIQNVATGEAMIKQAFPKIKDVRLRVHEKLARIEVSPEFVADFAAGGEKIITKLKALGFDFVTIDMEGFRSGSFDLGLDSLRKKESCNE